MLARRQENRGLVFLDANTPLAEPIPGFGLPIPVADVAGLRARLVLIHDGAAEPIPWKPSLAELLSGAPIAADVAAAWRERLDADKRGKTPLRRLFDFKKEKELRLEAQLSDETGRETPLGTIAFGSAVKRLVGLGRWDRVGALFGRAPVARSIPLSDTAVERGAEKKATDAARRGWRRLTGSLIVRP
jgi:hypothetical protein